MAKEPKETAESEGAAGEDDPDALARWVLEELQCEAELARLLSDSEQALSDLSEQVKTGLRSQAEVSAEDESTEP